MHLHLTFPGSKYEIVIRTIYEAEAKSNYPWYQTYTWDVKYVLIIDNSFLIRCPFKCVFELNATPLKMQPKQYLKHAKKKLQ